MRTRDWLLADSPASRFQANAGRAYRVLMGLLANPLSVLGGLIILALLITAAFAPWIAPYSPTGQNLGQRLLPPSAEFWMGTDELGRDIYSRVIWGSQITLTIVLLVALISAVLYFALVFALYAAFSGIDSIAEIALATVDTLFNVVTLAVIYPLNAAILTVLYYDTRVRNEGFDLQLLAALRQMTELVGHRAADGIELFFIKRRAKLAIEILELHIGADMPFAVVELAQVFFRILKIVLIRNFADDLFEHVLDGDEAGDTTILVHHNRHVLLRLQKRRQECGSPYRVRDQQWRVHHVSHAGVGPALIRQAEQVADVRHAHHVIERAPVDRVAAVAGLLEHMGRFGRYHSFGERDDGGARSHQLADGTVGERQHPRHDGHFVRSSQGIGFGS